MVFFFPGTVPADSYALSLHDALPICFTLPISVGGIYTLICQGSAGNGTNDYALTLIKLVGDNPADDRSSTRMNSRQRQKAFSVFCFDEIGFAAAASQDVQLQMPMAGY